MQKNKAYGFIYVITYKNGTTKKQYVGKTTKTISERWKDHLKDYKHKKREKRPLYAAMNKYGIEYFSIEELEKVAFKDLSNREMYWIEKLDTYYNGYNATKGGDGTMLYESEDFIIDYEDGLLQNEIAEKYGCDRGTVHRHLKAAGCITRRNSTTNRSKAVIQLDVNGNMIQKFESMSDAARWLQDQNLTKADISGTVDKIAKVCLKQRKTAYGYIWIYD